MAWKLAALALVGLLLGAGLCLLDEECVGTDLCNVSAVILTALAVAVSLAVAGRPELRLLSGYLALSPDLPVPPPRA